jgi:hypothetical protein
MRLSAAIVLAGVGVVGAVWLLGYRVSHFAANCAVDPDRDAPAGPCSWTTQPPWGVPASLLLSFAAIALAVSVLRPARR